MRFTTLIAAAVFVLPAAGIAECSQGHGLSDEQLNALDFRSVRDGPAGTVLDTGPYRLREVRYFRQNIFPDRNHWLARQANRYNTLTKARTIRRAFPLDPGDPVDETLRQEAERVLRDKPYLYDVVVLPRRVCSDEVDLDVVTRDRVDAHAQHRLQSLRR